MFSFDKAYVVDGIRLHMEHACGKDTFAMYVATVQSSCLSLAHIDIGTCLSEPIVASYLTALQCLLYFRHADEQVWCG